MSTLLRDLVTINTRLDIAMSTSIGEIRAISNCMDKFSSTDAKWVLKYQYNLYGKQPDGYWREVAITKSNIKSTDAHYLLKYKASWAYAQNSFDKQGMWYTYAPFRGNNIVPPRFLDTKALYKNNKLPIGWINATHSYIGYDRSKNRAGVILEDSNEVYAFNDNIHGVYGNIPGNYLNEKEWNRLLASPMFKHVQHATFGELVEIPEISFHIIKIR